MDEFVCIMKTPALEYLVWRQKGDFHSFPNKPKRTKYENEAWRWARFGFGNLPIVVYSVTRIDENE
ncbi:hypothetical protein KAR91_49255 [Candidatus Pacearchaeota archaeon]|nr:hypothetical protein [Candidatus Pacearchaeota archaeon]